MLDNYFLHKTSIVSDDSIIGKDSEIWHFTHIYGNSIIGKKCTIGQNVMIGPEVILGNGCKIQNNVSLYKGIILEDNVFCGPSCVFTNVKTPRAFIDRSKEFSNTIIKKGASIGANSTIICGVTVGEFALIGAGALITKDVLPYSLVLGAPARHIGWVSEAGERLGKDLICKRTGDQYQVINKKLYKKNG